MCRSLYLIALAALVTPAAFAQSIVSVRSGAVHYTEGQVLLDDAVLERKFGEFAHVRENSVLATERGRAEVLLTPGVFLRMGENTAIRMISTELDDTRFLLVRGSILVEVAELLKDNAVTLYVARTPVTLWDEGLYRFDAQPARLRVYDGEAIIWDGDEPLSAKKGRLVPLGGDPAIEKFDTDSTDALHRWSARRARYIALANLSAAKSLHDSRGSWGMAGWGWNPWLGMITFIPARGTRYSPFGYAYWSPREVQRVYEPPRRVSPGFAATDGPRYRPDLGYTVVPRTASGSSTPSATAGESAPANPRTSESAAPRGSEGGGRGR